MLLVIGTGFLPSFLIDVFTLFGVLGTAATLIGLWLTYEQLKRTTKVAEAARDAALLAEVKDRQQFAGFVVGSCHRLVNEAKIFVDASRWELAAIRVADLADSFVQLGRSADVSISSCEDSIAQLREWESTFRKQSPGKSLNPNSAKKWTAFLVLIQSQIDKTHGPFGKSFNGEVT